MLYHLVILFLSLKSVRARGISVMYPYGVVRLKKKVVCNRKDVSNRLCNYKWAGIRALVLAYDIEPLFKERAREQRTEREAENDYGV